VNTWPIGYKNTGSEFSTDGAKGERESSIGSGVRGRAEKEDTPPAIRGRAADYDGCQQRYVRGQDEAAGVDRRAG